MILLSEIQMLLIYQEYSFPVEGTASIGASINLLIYTLIMAYTLAMLRCHGLWNAIMLSILNRCINNIGRFLMSSYQYWGMIVKKQLANGEVELLKLGLLPKFLHASVHGYFVDYLDDKDHLYTWEAVEIKSGNFPIVKSEYKGFVKDTREHIYKLQVAANRDHLKTAGARDYQTGQLKSKPHPYEPLEKE